MAIRPPLLQRGDTIGLVTPGSPLEADIINARVQTLLALGFNVVFGRYVYSFEGIVAAPDEQRAEDVMMMFTDPNVKMILPTRGGTGVQTMLPYLDYEVIRDNPKIVTGYSDITVLLNTLYQRSDLITFHSLMLIDFRPDTPAYNFDQFFTATSTLTAPRMILNPPGIPLISLVPGNVTGPIVGGNLTSIVNTLGTPFEIDTDGKILFLEETHAPTTLIYRYLIQLLMAGKFDNCLGIIMGECTNCPVSYGTTYQDLINALLVPLGKPLMVNLATAHGFYKAAIPIGATVNLDTVNNMLTVLEPTVSV
ncbi:muramoyltetrapeptide carboxypeptidase [Caldalkalibacillus uzonensis]|uniref:Muramoyltetrapeptide carboxypeptidase n=1 Tax=Caldalkalibacillus uzonensis TaxID=353224 RepID=A0ABU0CRL2_9BACI|nr:LD-carboxypeptidase [Caldalkalibacillus uzonensis]MDQ0338787.1 muramoyltetrapeptide carboxypeptidase [Caldalkalibacillus uzonensis]